MMHSPVYARAWVVAHNQPTLTRVVPAIGVFEVSVCFCLIDYMPSQLNRMVATALLLGVMAFLTWAWVSSRSFGTRRWPVQLPSRPVVLLQIMIGIFDLGTAALAMYVLLPSEMNVGLFCQSASKIDP
jgi:uncharacterized membrane protein YbhN (UPF0104 family)